MSLSLGLAQDPKMTDWLWEVRESSEQKKIFQNWRKDKLGFVLKMDRDHRFPKKRKNVSATRILSIFKFIFLFLRMNYKYFTVLCF